MQSVRMFDFFACTRTGLMYGNNPYFEMAVGEKVRWHLIAVGDQVGLHTAHFHAQTVLMHST